MRKFILVLAATFAYLLVPAAQDFPAMPADYKQVLDSLGRQGDFKDGVLKVNIPRNDLKVVVDGIETTLPLFRALVREADIIDGNYHIHWLEQFLAKGGMDA